ncbi:hypothetical protein ACHAW6_011999 [Cyclotella cf. meneghiniana]
MGGYTSNPATVCMAFPRLAALDVVS